MQFYGYHGLFAEENKLGQRFNVSVELYTSLKKAGESDAMEDSIHYGVAFELVKGVVEGPSFNLIEAVAEEISKRLLAEFPELEKCRVQVEKPNPPINGHYESVAVDILRERIQ